MLPLFTFLPALFIMWCFFLLCCRVTPPDGDTSPSGAPGCSDGLLGATGGTGAMAMPATSTLSLPMSQAKPSLRRIKGRIHRSKSLDSIDLLDSNVSLTHDLITPTYICVQIILYIIYTFLDKSINCFVCLKIWNKIFHSKNTYLNVLFFFSTNSKKHKDILFTFKYDK